MKILQLCNKAPFPANDGSSIAIYNMSCGLLENQAELYLFTINTLKHFKPDENVPEAFKKKCHYRSVFRDTGVKPIGAFLNLFSEQSYFVSRFYFEEFAQQLRQLLREVSFDIIHLEGVFIGCYLPVIRQYSQAKVVVRTHNIEHLIWERYLANESHPVKKWYIKLQNKRLKKFELDILAKSDAIVPITEFDRSYLEGLGIKTSYLVSPTGINLTNYIQRPEQEEKYSVFHFGSMDWLPNREAVDWFLQEVWDKYFHESNQFTLYIAGRNMPPHIQHTQLPGVKVITEVESQIDFYNSKAIMIVPLLSGSGMRIKILEGMAMGKPIIATSIGAEGIPAEHNKNIIIANTAGEFAQAIKNLASDNEFKSVIQKNARIFISQYFNNQLLTKELLSFYTQLISD